MSINSGTPPIMSGPNILDLEVARTKAALSSTGDWSSRDLARLCKVHGIYSGSVDYSKLLLVMLEKSFTQPVVYEGFGLPNLIGFIRARGLDVDEDVKDAVSAAESSPEAGRQTATVLSATSHLFAESETEGHKTIEETAHKSTFFKTLTDGNDEFFDWDAEIVSVSE